VLKGFRPPAGKLRLDVRLDSGAIRHPSGKRQPFPRSASKLLALAPPTFFIAQPL
jgi:hypothetical protein